MAYALPNCPYSNEYSSHTNLACDNPLIVLPINIIPNFVHFDTTINFVHFDTTIHFVHFDTTYLTLLVLYKYNTTQHMLVRIAV